MGMNLGKGVGLFETLFGTLLGLGNLDQARRLQEKIGKDLANPPLSLGGGEMSGLVSPQAREMFGLDPQTIGMLGEQAGGMPIGLQLSELARTQGEQTGAWQSALDTLGDVPVQPWSQDVHQGMVEQSAERINQAGQGLQQQTAQGIATRGRGRGLYGLTGGPAAGLPMAMATERSAAERGLTATREIQTRSNLERKLGNIASLQRQKPIQGIDWASMLAPAMGWPIAKANAEMGVAGLGLNATAGLSSGLIGAGGQTSAAAWMPTPEAPSPWPGVIGQVGSAAIPAGIAALTALSDRNAKENFKPVSEEAVLKAVENLDVTRWNYKGDDAEHIGPMAQDFHAAFGLGHSDRRIDIIDAFGITLAAIKALAQRVRELEGQIMPYVEAA